MTAEIITFPNFKAAQTAPAAIRGGQTDAIRHMQGFGGSTVFTGDRVRDTRFKRTGQDGAIGRRCGLVMQFKELPGAGFADRHRALVQWDGGIREWIAPALIEPVGPEGGDAA